MNRPSKAAPSRLRAVIRKGRERGRLTYDELRDQLPEDLRGADQLEPVVAMFADLGVNIVDEAPDTDALFAPGEGTDDEDAIVDEFEAAMAAGRDESRASEDPMRAYMRQMGKAALLTREQEVALAKRIEDGLAERAQAMAACPAAIAQALQMAERVGARWRHR